VIRGSAVVVLAALVAGWVAYVHEWRYGGVRPLVYRLGKVHGYMPRRPGFRVTTTGDVERVLITSGPRSSSGYSIQVQRAIVERSRVWIAVREIDKPGRAEITYPYRLLVFRKIDKPVHIHWEGRS
jgi:PrcB C-terminal